MSFSRRFSPAYLAALCLTLLLATLLAGCGEDTRPTSVPIPTEVVITATPTVALPTPIPPESLPPLTFVAATPTPTPVVVVVVPPTPTYRPTATPEVAPLPPPPQFDIAQPDVLAKNIAGWLNKQNDALPGKDKGPETARDRLRDLLLGWSATGQTLPVELADLDGDGQPELVATVAESWSEVPSIRPDYGFLLVLKGNKTTWTANTLRSRGLKASAREDFAHPALAKVADLNGDKQADIVFTEYTCGANTCATTLHVVDWANGKFTDLTPDAPSMATAQLGFDTGTGGTTALTLSGGTINSFGAGLQRQRTEYYTWDAPSKTFKLTDTRFASSFYLYHRVQDGNYALDKGNYALAIDLYNGALTDPTLKLWFNETQGGADKVQIEREVLTAFARFRLGIAYALNNDPAKATATMQDAIAKDGRYAGWAKNFLPAYQSSKASTPSAKVREACAPAIKFSQENLGLIEGMNMFGLANPNFKPEDICPVLK